MSWNGWAATVVLAMGLVAPVGLAAPPRPAPGAAPAASSRWEATLERVSRAVVSIEVTATRDFDTESASSSVGTGFVVDAERGLILTNRHMVHAGPVVARAVFLDNEEVHLEPIYRDPVHDFGFYRFDPSALRYHRLEALQLAPDAAKVGMEIRVVGNDAGEKLSILDGTLARLDRNAPVYGRGTYNDFDTFYYQAASNTSGGSSGSPVVDVDGRVVALNAGGRTEAASSFYLPLHRVAHALERLREGRPIPRGTLLTTWTWEAWQDVRRLGLSEGTEARVRAAFPTHSGMLVVSKVLPGGPGEGALRPGDVVVSIDDRLVRDFVDAEAVLDDRVGGRIRLGIERLGRPLDVVLDVRDLHAVSPSGYLEIGRAVLHPLSYQVARSYDLAVQGVVVATPGWMFGTAGVPSGALLSHVDGVPIPDLDALEAVLASKADRQRVRVRWAALGDARVPRESVVTVDRTWFAARRCTRDDAVGRWPCTDLAPPPEAAPPEPATATLRPEIDQRRLRPLADALVLVTFEIPYSTAGISGTSFAGAGVVVDRERGLVVVDRDTVPVALGALEITFAGAVRVPAEIVWLHPVHNVAFLRYDPAALGSLPVGEVAFVDRWPEKGEKLTLVGLDRAGRVVVDDGEVEKVDALLLDPGATPRQRDVHVEAIALARVERTIGGVLVDSRRRPVALWSSFFFPSSKEAGFFGLPASYVLPWLDAIRAGGAPEVRLPGIELRPRTLADARERGLADSRIADYRRADPDRSEILEVVRVSGGTPAESLLRPSDVLVLADGRPVTRMREVEAWGRHDAVDLVVLRDGAEVEVRLPLVSASGSGVRDVVLWAGTTVHAPHDEVARDKGLAPEGAYVAWYWFGSPAARDGVRPTRRITRVGDRDVPDYATFLDIVAALDPSEPVVLTLEDLDGVTTVRVVELDLDDWPTERIRWQDGRWHRVRLAP